MKKKLNENENLAITTQPHSKALAEPVNLLLTAELKKRRTYEILYRPCCNRCPSLD